VNINISPEDGAIARVTITPQDIRGEASADLRFEHVGQALDVAVVLARQLNRVARAAAHMIGPDVGTEEAPGGDGPTFADLERLGYLVAALHSFSIHYD
jgi:hypothetical protein